MSLKETLITVKCAWCGKDMGTKEGHGVTGISHGICDKCLEDMGIKDEKKSMEKHGKNIGQLYKNNVSKNNDTY